MKPKITSEQRALIDQLLDRGEDRHTIAQLASVTPGQVSAVAAHRTMRKSTKHIGAEGTTAPILGMTAESAGLTRRSEEGSSPQPTAIPLGTDIDLKRPVLWDPYASSNPHVLIVGESGSGKTYTASRLAIELARAHLPSIVFDYGQGFSLEHAPRAFRDDVRTVELNLGRDGIAIIPLQIFPVDTHGHATVAQRVADTFLGVSPR
jgi:hypothetical protein